MSQNGVPKWSKNVPEKCQSESCRNCGRSWAAQGPKKSPKKQKMTPDGPQMAQNGPGKVPKWSQNRANHAERREKRARRQKRERRERRGKRDQREKKEKREKRERERRERERRKRRERTEKSDEGRHDGGFGGMRVAMK